MKRGCQTISRKGRPPALARRDADGRRPQERDDDDRQEGERGLPQEGAGERRPRTASRVQITVWGPMIPAASPPHMTQEIARGLKDLGGRVGRGEAVALDEGAVEPDDEGAEAEEQEARRGDAERGEAAAGNAEARAEDVADAPPRRRMNNAAGMVPSASPRWSEADRQGRESLSVARACPTMPPSEITMAGLAPPSACAAARTTALCFARRSSLAAPGRNIRNAGRSRHRSVFRTVHPKDRQVVSCDDSADDGQGMPTLSACLRKLSSRFRGTVQRIS